ncbi:putative Nudix hydrolase YfcD [compost metagenome]
MSQDEYFDIFDEHMNRIGKATRREAHAKGLWHRTFHCWILREGSGDGEILLQLRHRDKDTFPGLLDVSCAGHLQAGEQVEDGLRELEEELGIKASYQELLFAGVSADEYELDHAGFDREFSHIHLFACAQPLEEYKLQLEEVSGLYAVPVGEWEALVRGRAESASAHGVIYDDSGSSTIVERRITLEDMTPNSQGYYDKLLAGISQLTLAHGRSI